MRRKRLARLGRKLRAMRRSLPQQDRLLLRIGAAKKETGGAFGFVKIHLPANGEWVTRQTFPFNLKSQTLRRRTTRWTLPSAQQSDQRRPSGVVDALCATDPDGERVSLLKERMEHSSHLSPDRAARRSPYLDCLLGLLFTSHAEKPADDSRAGTNCPGGSGEAGHYPMVEVWIPRSTLVG